MKISSPEDYFAALAMTERDGTEANVGALEEAIKAYLLGLSPMKRKQIAVHAPDEILRAEHEWRVDQIDGNGGWRHRAFLHQLAVYAGGRPSGGDLKTLAAAGAAMVQRRIESRKQRIKEKGRIVQCQMCAGHVHSGDTERIKPYGSMRYQRFCSGCAAKVKDAKRLYQGMSRNKRTKA